MFATVRQLFGSAEVTLLLAVCALLGSWIYFVLPTEPNVAAVTGLSMGSIALWSVSRRWHVASLVLAGAAMCLVTIAVATVHTALWPTTFMPESASGTRMWVTGRVRAVDPNPPYVRLELDQAEGYGEQGNLLPPTIRITVHASRAEGVRIGDHISAVAQMFSPSPPAFVGDYDGRRAAFFDGIGAVGMVQGDFYMTPQDINSLWSRLNNLRNMLAAKLGAQNGVAAALLTGVRGYVPDRVADAFRASGLAHLMAISGLHVGMVAGMVFFGLQKSFALFPSLILRYPMRRIAACAAMGVTIGYALLAGMSIPTMRALMMVLALLLAVVLDRVRSSLHILGLAAITAIWLWPDAAVGASFQMSFIAAFALILWVRGRPDVQRSRLGWVRRLGYIQGVWATSVVAGLVTLPLAAWHFGVVSLAGFFTNLAAIPLMGFVVMPLALLSLLGQLFGGIAFMDTLYAQSCAWLTQVALVGADWEWAFDVSPQIGGWLLVCSWAAALAYITRHKKSAAILAVLTGILTVFSPLMVREPDVVELEGGKIALVRKAPQTYYVAALSGDEGEVRLLKRFADFRHVHLVYPVTGELPCDSIGCVYAINGQSVLALASNVFPEADDAIHAALILGMPSFEDDLSHWKTREIYLNPQAIHKDVYTLAKGRPWQ